MEEGTQCFLEMNSGTKIQVCTVDVPLIIYIYLQRLLVMVRKRMGNFNVTGMLLNSGPRRQIIVNLSEKKFSKRNSFLEFRISSFEFEFRGFSFSTFNDFLEIFNNFPFFNVFSQDFRRNAPLLHF